MKRFLSVCSSVFLWLMLGGAIGAASGANRRARELDRIVISLSRRLEVLERIRQADMLLELKRVLETPVEPVVVPETHPFGCERSPLGHARQECQQW